MKLLEKEEEKIYSHLADEIACTIYTESLSAVEELGQEVITADTSEAVGMATGQVAYDRMIELTKDISKEQLIKFFTLSLGMGVTDAMNVDRNYFMKIMLLSLMKKGGM